MYVSPNPTDAVEYDDQHILYATLFDQKNRQRPTIAVTNDFMRNHAMVSFGNIQLYYRWRKTQVANYVLSYQLNSSKNEVEKNKYRLLLKLPGIFVC